MHSNFLSSLWQEGVKVGMGIFALALNTMTENQTQAKRLCFSVCMSLCESYAIHHLASSTNNGPCGLGHSNTSSKACKVQRDDSLHVKPIYKDQFASRIVVHQAAMSIQWLAVMVLHGLLTRWDTNFLVGALITLIMQIVIPAWTFVHLPSLVRWKNENQTPTQICPQMLFLD